MSGGVYIITNDVSRKIYVGSAVNFEKRWAEHRRLLAIGEHKNRHLQAAWKLYGEDSFRFSIAVVVHDKSERLAAEQLAIDSMAACDPAIGYNISAVATSRLGVRASGETCRKIGASKVGNKNRLGKTFSQESKDKIRAALIGRAISDAAKAKMSITRKGRPQSAAHIAARTASRWDGRRVNERGAQAMALQC
jgi:group I intron endonuclease